MAPGVEPSDDRNRKDIMRAMQAVKPGAPLEATDRDLPPPGPGTMNVTVRACGVCRTDLHVADGELPDIPYPITPGHEVVGVVEGVGEGVDRWSVGDRVGVPWLAWACGDCLFCREGHENLCQRAEFTGYTRHGGYAEAIAVDARFALPLPDAYSDEQAAPLLCAGLIGHRCLTMAGDGRRLGLYGFGAAAHIVAQIATWQGRSLFAFTRPGDDQAQDFARAMGAHWAGPSDGPPPEPLDAAIIFAPVGDLVPAALEAVRPGGIVVCGGIHMSDIPSFAYRLLWQERVLRSVANLTRKDGEAFMALAPRVPVRTETTAYPLAEANRALGDLRDGRLSGAAVLVP